MALSAEALRKLAQGILEERRFHEPRVPRPLHGILGAIGAGLNPLVHEVERLAASLGRHLPGGAPTAWALLAIIVLGLSALLSTRFARRALSSPRASTAPRTASAPSAGDLERAAVVAEEHGRLSDAVRLRFQAGLLGLLERDAIPAAAGLPNAGVSRVLRSESFDTLARRFDEIVYGEAEAEPKDVASARREWPAVLRSISTR